MARNGFVESEEEEDTDLPMRQRRRGLSRGEAREDRGLEDTEDWKSDGCGGVEEE